MPFQEYSSDSAYFIAGGKTLEIIRQFEKDVENREASLQAIADEYGAYEVSPNANDGRGAFYADHKIDDLSPALKFRSQSNPSYGPVKYYYDVNEETPEGRALQERLDDIPSSTEDYAVFAKRLTGAEFVPTNPDNLFYREDFASRVGHYKTGNEDIAASYRQYGNVYVVEVPRTIVGIGIQFNEASEKEFRPALQTASAYQYDWFTPPDSGRPIPYSQVVALQEKEMGDQTTPRRVKARLEIRTPHPDRF